MLVCIENFFSGGVEKESILWDSMYRSAGSFGPKTGQGYPKDTGVHSQFDKSG